MIRCRAISLFHAGFFLLIPYAVLLAGDAMSGSAGGDTIVGTSGGDQIRGYGGDDRLSGGNGNDDLEGGAGDDELQGGDGNDELEGGAGDDKLLGGDGSDELAGGEGHDQLEGGSGNDVLIGGTGFDILFGGSGSDKFIIDVEKDYPDEIRDFSPEEGDTVILRFKQRESSRPLGDPAEDVYLSDRGVVKVRVLNEGVFEAVKLKRTDLRMVADGLGQDIKLVFTKKM